MGSAAIGRGLKFIRITIGLGLAYILIHLTINSTGANVWTEMVRANRLLLLLSLLFYSSSIYLSVERLNILLSIQNIKIGKWNITKLSMIGNFFSLIIPGGVSGDLVKMVYLAKQTKKRKAEAVLTIFLDRVIGMLGLMIVAAAIIFWFLPQIDNVDLQHQPIQSAILGLGIGSISGVLIFFLLLMQSFKKGGKKPGKIYEWIRSKLPPKIFLLVDRLIAALALYRNNRVVIVKTLLLSICIHLSLGVNLFLVGWCVGENIIRLRDYILATQIGNLIGVLPITPGGVGLRDISTALILKTQGALPEMAGVIPIVMTLIIIFWRLIGCGFFIFSNFSKSEISKGMIISKRENPA